MPKKYSPLTHNHDSRYYTETEVNNILSPTRKEITMYSIWGGGGGYYTVGKLCIFSIYFKNGLNPSGMTQMFGSNMPAAYENINMIGYTFDNSVTYKAIPCTINTSGQFWVGVSIPFQHDVSCNGIYRIA